MHGTHTHAHMMHTRAHVIQCDTYMTRVCTCDTRARVMQCDMHTTHVHAHVMHTCTHDMLMYTWHSCTCDMHTCTHGHASVGGSIPARPVPPPQPGPWLHPSMTWTQNEAHLVHRRGEGPVTPHRAPGTWRKEGGGCQGLKATPCSAHPCGWVWGRSSNRQPQRSHPGCPPLLGPGSQLAGGGGRGMWVSPAPWGREPAPARVSAQLGWQSQAGLGQAQAPS